jgi:hypothetical protein
MTRSPVPADPAQAHLAQAHLAWMRYPLDDPRMADMRDEIDRINALGDRSPGCLWRFETAGGTATDVRVLDDPRVLFNLTVWRSVEDLRRYVYRTEHVAFFRRRTSRSCCGGSRRVSVRAWRTPWRGSNGCGARAPPRPRLPSNARMGRTTGHCRHYRRRRRRRNPARRPDAAALLACQSRPRRALGAC